MAKMTKMTKVGNVSRGTLVTKMFHVEHFFVAMDTKIDMLPKTPISHTLLNAEICPTIEFWFSAPWCSKVTSKVSLN